MLIRIENIEHGWMDVELRRGAKSFTLESLSDIAPGLGDMLRAAISAETGEREVSATFALEPGYMTLSLRQTSSGCRLRVSRPDRGDRGQRSDALLDWHIASAREFSLAVVAAAKDILDRLGQEKYEDSWTFEPFPVGELKALERIIRDDI